MAYLVPALNVLFLLGMFYAGKKFSKKFMHTKEELAKDLNDQSKLGGTGNV